MMKNKDESFHVIYLNLIGILISYILDHKNKIPKDVHNLYSFIMGSSQRYKSLGIRIQNIPS